MAYVFSVELWLEKNCANNFFGDKPEGNTMLVPIVSNKNVLLPILPNQMVNHAVNAILEPYPWNKPSKRSLDGLLITSKVGMG